MEVPVGPQARLGTPPCLSSHARGLFSGRQSFLDRVSPLCTSNHGGETAKQTAFPGWEKGFLLNSHFCRLVLLTPVDWAVTGPHREGGVPTFREGRFFF